jgi:hypothetical protein
MYAHFQIVLYLPRKGAWRKFLITILKSMRATNYCRLNPFYDKSVLLFYVQGVCFLFRRVFNVCPKCGWQGLNNWKAHLLQHHRGEVDETKELEKVMFDYFHRHLQVGADQLNAYIGEQPEAVVKLIHKIVLLFGHKILKKEEQFLWRGNLRGEAYDMPVSIQHPWSGDHTIDDIPRIDVEVSDGRGDGTGEAAEGGSRPKKSRLSEEADGPAEAEDQVEEEGQEDEEEMTDEEQNADADEDDDVEAHAPGDLSNVIVAVAASNEENMDPTVIPCRAEGVGYSESKLDTDRVTRSKGCVPDNVCTTELDRAIKRIATQDFKDVEVRNAFIPDDPVKNAQRFLPAQSAEHVQAKEDQPPLKPAEQPAVDDQAADGVLCIGRGLWATKTFEVGDVIGNYPGQVKTLSLWDQQYDEPENGGNEGQIAYYQQLDTSGLILPSGKRAFKEDVVLCVEDPDLKGQAQGHFINHSPCETHRNVSAVVTRQVDDKGGWKPVLLFRAQKRVLAGQQFYRDYGSEYRWPNSRVTCPVCQKTVEVVSKDDKRLLRRQTSSSSGL